MNDRIEEKIYNRMCRGCRNEKKCHDECEHCDEFWEKYEKEEKK